MTVAAQADLQKTPKKTLLSFFSTPKKQETVPPSSTLKAIATGWCGSDNDPDDLVSIKRTSSCIQAENNLTQDGGRDAGDDDGENMPVTINVNMVDR